MKREWNQDISQFCIWLVDCVVSVGWWNKTIKCNPGLFLTLSCFNKLVAIIPFLWLKTQSDFFWRCLKFSSFWYSSVLCNLWLFLSLMNLLVNPPLAELILTHNVIKNTFFFPQEKDQLQDVFDPLTFDLTYDLSQSPSCTLCPILNDHNDIAQRSFRATVSVWKRKPYTFQPGIYLQPRCLYVK